ncbi:hypothetical protein FQN52_009477 [Onygenales sp. PD_12]|nr:hypothetical protein FQN52_009477 [Onygenales sp. PD_12]
MRILLPCATVLAGLAQIVHSANPLATKDQRDLDILATALSQSDDFNALRSAARAQFILTLKKFGKDIDDDINSDIDIAIDELVFSSVQKAVNGDPAYPRVYWVDAPPREENWFDISVPGGRYSYDNPDCIYRTIPISDKYEYVIRGRRAENGPTDVTFSLISNPNSQGTVASLMGDDLQLEDDGTFAITISPKDSDAKNHIKSNWQAVQLFVRNNLANWTLDTPDELSVEIIDRDDVEPASNKSIIAEAKKHLAESSFFYGFGALDLKTFLQPLNKLQKPTQSQLLGTLTTQASSFGHFNLADDEAMVVTITSGKSTYWVLPVYSLGMVTHSPWENIVSFNSNQAKPNNNGTYTFVVSKEDAGVYNWINTTARSQGTIMGRWQGLPTDGDGTEGIEVFSNIVKLCDLPDVLPGETEYVDAQQRAEQVRERIQGYNRIHQQ